MKLNARTIIITHTRRVHEKVKPYIVKSVPEVIKRAQKITHNRRVHKKVKTLIVKTVPEVENKNKNTSHYKCS